MKTLIFQIANKHRLIDQIASELGKSPETIRKTLDRGNARADYRFAINDAFYKVTNRHIDSITLWRPTRKDQVHTFY